MIFTRSRSPIFIHLLMVVSAALVSTSFVVGAAITDQLDPAVLTLLRFVIATMVFAPLIYCKYGATFSFDLLWRCSIISSCLVVFFWCMFLSLRYTTPLNTSVIFTLVPSIAWFYGFFLVAERLTRGKIIALFCGMVGAVWVIFKGDLSAVLAMQWNKGDLIFLAGGFAIGLYTPLVKLLHRGEPMAVMTFWVLFSGSCWLILFNGYKLPQVGWADIPVNVWFGICYLAVFTTVITFFLTQYAITFLGSTRVMAYSYLYPGMVLLINLILGHGLPSLSVLPGVAIVLTSMVILQCSEG
jgi:drug/metabolite transporter (DMT)-like permease